MTDPIRVLAQARQALLRTQALYDLARSLMEASSEEEVLQRVVSAPTELLGVNRSVLIALDTESQVIRHFLVAGPGARYVQRPAWDELSTGLTGWVLRERQVAVSPQGYFDPRESPQVQLRRQQTHCGGIVVLPIEVGRAVCGTLTLIHAPQAGDFTDDEVAWLEALVYQAAAALDGQRHRRQLHGLAPFDPLTGLPSPVLAEDRLRQAVARSQVSRLPFALMRVNIDHLTQINSRHARAVGDELLVQVARRLEQAVRPPNTVARLHGDEFLLLVENLHGEQGVFPAMNPVMNAFREPFTVGEHRLSVTASTGVAVFPFDGQDAQALQQHAGLALQTARRSGGAAAARFAQDPRAHPEMPGRIAAALQGAVDRHELSVVYQPQFGPQQQLTGFEALLRWKHDHLGLVSPDVFIPVAEASGLIVPLGEWVLRSACEQLRAWLGQSRLPLRMAVNVSQVQLRQSGFVKMVGAALRETGVAPEHLELELTERVVMEHLGAAREQFQALRDLGVHLALDDFGAGQSSMRQLAHLPFDVLKLDRSFIHGMERDARAHQIACTLTELGHSMGMEVVVEGIETPEQLRLALQMGCDRTQGYLLGRPVPAEAARAWLSPGDEAAS